VPFDVRFSVHDDVFEAHKLVAAVQSGWFMAAIYNHDDGNKRAETTRVEEQAG
jgi:hypothetical protein